MKILSINCGSSSVKTAIHAIGEREELIWKGSSYQNVDAFDAIGHRIVQGGPLHRAPCKIDAAVIKALKSYIPNDPDHLPAEIAAIEWMAGHFPDKPQVACFDTYFHRTIPDKAKHFAIPRRFWEKGVFRYGFHGLSYEYVVSQLPKKGRFVIAHLGNGASMAAVENGRCVDTSMGFTPLGGLVMGTRPGDLDPGVVLFLQKEVKDLSHLLNQESGLLGISGISHDMKELLAMEKQNPHAAEAIEIFCYQAKKTLGAYKHLLGGIDAVVFTGGIGENALTIRERIAEGEPNVLVIKTDEELMIARHTYRELYLGGGGFA